MKPSITVRNLVLGAALSMVASGWHAAAVAKSAPEYVKPPLKLNAALIVPDDKMVGPGYKMDPVAINDGFSNTYTLATDAGQVKVVSDYQLARQIQEVRAMRALNEMSQSGVFGDAMKEGAMAPVEGGKALVTAPVETTKGAVKGIGRWMGNIGRAVKSDDPYQEGGVSAAVGWAGTKRAFALELGVDPNTDWEPLQEALTKVGRAAFAGGITVGVAMDAVGTGTVGTVITVTSLTADMNAVLLDNPPEGLTKINSKKLKGMGISNNVIDPFLLNYNYTPMEKTLLVAALERMKGAKGRELFIAQATAAPDKVMARYFQQNAEMMAHYHTKVQATDLVKIDNEVWQLNRKGVLVGAFPIDYLAWTSEASTIAGGVEKNPKAKQRELWLEGSASPEARKGLTARGWKVNERVGFLTGKPLQEQTAAGAGMGAVGAGIGLMR